MTTYLLHNFETITEPIYGIHKHVYSEFEQSGLPNKLTAYFRDKTEQEKIPATNPIAVSGEPDPKQLEIVFRNAHISQFPTADNWETFIATELFSAGATVELSKSTEYSYLNAWKNNLYVWCGFDKSKMTLDKFEFGRYLPLEKPEDKQKSSSWTKGVFTNSDKFNVRFLQTSWDGENGKDYQLYYSEESKQKLMSALQILLDIGWTELDYRLDAQVYKLGASVTVDGETKVWTYPLLDIGEQDIPLLGDKLGQWLMMTWADSFLNDKRRHIDVFKVEPMRKEKTSR